VGEGLPRLAMPHEHRRDLVAVRRHEHAGPPVDKVTQSTHLKNRPGTPA
jgi:hypothetical protein